MASGETGVSDVTFDLVSVQDHSLKAGHDYGQCMRDAKNAGLDDAAGSFDEVMNQDAKRAEGCHKFLAQLKSVSAPSPSWAETVLTTDPHITSDGSLPGVRALDAA